MNICCQIIKFYRLRFDIFVFTTKKDQPTDPTQSHIFKYGLISGHACTFSRKSSSHYVC